MIFFNLHLKFSKTLLKTYLKLIFNKIKTDILKFRKKIIF